MIGRNGIRDALLAAVLFGLSAPIAKILVGSVSPQALAGLLYIGSGIGLTILALFRSGSARASAGLRASDIPFLTAAIAFGGIAAPVLLMFGLQRTPASGASLLLNLEAVFTVVIAWAVFRENINSHIAAGLAAIVAGGLVLSWTGSFQLAEYAGPLAIAAACLCWGVDNNLTQRISAADPVRIASLKGLAAGTVNTVLAFSLGHYTPLMWPALALGFVSYGLSLVLYIRALREMGTARAGNYFSVAPFVGAILGVLLWRDPVTLALSAAGALMGVGVWLNMTETHEHVHIHEPMTHEHLHTHDIHHQHEHLPTDPPGEPHTHPHRHERLEHSHPHYPDIHHRHQH
jgi:drug/metabolite transporter (DMT)-like permease